MDIEKSPAKPLLKEIKFDLVGGVGALLHLGWMTTLRWQYIDRKHFFDARGRYGHVIFAFWHGQLLVPAFIGRDWGVHILISESDDGEYIARMVSRLGFRAVRGSATRGGKGALRKLVRAGEKAHLGITPDGPMGPRHKVHPGTIFLAQATGLPLFPVASAAKWCYRVGSWDRFEIPLPGSPIAVAAGEPILVAKDADDEACRQAQERLEASLNALTDRAREAVGLRPEGTTMKPGLQTGRTRR
jgi:lysophospholipid acyltransferase (LPLAT)-like uncharacterized protein